MKTEMEQLKENTEKARALDQLAELAKYQVATLEKIHLNLGLHNRSSYLEFATMVVSILTIFTGPDYIHDIAFNLFLFVMFRNWAFIYPALSRACGRYRGFIDTLEIIGYITKDDGDNKRRRVKRWRMSWIEQLWEITKQQKRNEAYA